MQTLSSVARAVWRDDIGLFHQCVSDGSFISSCVHLAATLVIVLENCVSRVVGQSYTVTIFMSEMFNRTYAEMKQHLINKELAEIDKEDIKRKGAPTSKPRRRAVLLEWLGFVKPFRSERLCPARASSRRDPCVRCWRIHIGLLPFSQRRLREQT